MGDTANSPHHRVLAQMSSIQIVKETPSFNLSDVKEDLEKAGSEPVQFPEGGTAAWCVVRGGKVSKCCMPRNPA